VGRGRSTGYRSPTQAWPGERRSTHGAQLQYLFVKKRPDGWMRTGRRRKGAWQGGYRRPADGTGRLMPWLSVSGVAAGPGRRQKRPPGPRPESRKVTFASERRWSAAPLLESVRPPPAAPRPKGTGHHGAGAATIRRGRTTPPTPPQRSSARAFEPSQADLHGTERPAASRWPREMWLQHFTLFAAWAVRAARSRPRFTPMRSDWTGPKKRPERKQGRQFFRTAPGTAGPLRGPCRCMTCSLGGLGRCRKECWSNRPGTALYGALSSSGARRAGSGSRRRAACGRVQRLLVSRSGLTCPTQQAGPWCWSSARALAKRLCVDGWEEVWRAHGLLLTRLYGGNAWGKADRPRDPVAPRPRFWPGGGPWDGADRGAQGGGSGSCTELLSLLACHDLPCGRATATGGRRSPPWVARSPHLGQRGEPHPLPAPGRRPHAAVQPSGS